MDSNSEIFDSSATYMPHGCLAPAWTAAEVAALLSENSVILQKECY